MMGSMRKSRLSHYKLARLIEHFVSGSTARTSASLYGVNRKTAAFFFLRLREIIAYELEAESEAMFGGEIEVDESYFGGKRKGTLSKRQVRLMLDAPDTKSLQGLRDRALLHVYFYVGARCSEPANLKVKDFGYDAEFPVLNLTIKGNKTNTVAINLECEKALREYLDSSAHAENPNAYIFQPMINGRPGSPLARMQLYKLFDRYARKASISVRVFPHVARATMITSAFEAGCAGEDIQRTVGHASITTTEGYNHTAQKHRQSASLKVDY